MKREYNCLEEESFLRYSILDDPVPQITTVATATAVAC
jgi:hypothetical protein